MGLFLPLVVMYLFNWIMFTIIIASICKHISPSKRKSPLRRRKEKALKFNIQNFIITVVLSITLGLGWGFGFLATSHDIRPVVIIFQGIFTVVVGIHGVLLFILHGIRNPDVRAFWKSITVSRKTGKLFSSFPSTDTKSTKQASMPYSPSTDLGLSHSYHNDCSATKSPQKFNLVPATETNNNSIEGIPSHSNVDSKEVGIALDTHMLIQDAYEAEKQDVLIQGHEGFVSMMIKIFEQQFAGVHKKDCMTW